MARSATASRLLPLGVTIAMLAAACASNGSTASTTAANSSSVTSTTLGETTSTTAPTSTTVRSTTTLPTTTTAETSPLGPTFPTASGRESIPWETVGAGWYVVLYDSSEAYPTDPGDPGAGPVALYLVDAGGNRYQVADWPADDRPWLLADAVGTSALVVGSGATGDDRVWHLIDLTTGATRVVHTATFPETSYTGGRTVSLTRPTGANLVVHGSDGSMEWLERRTPSGTLLATVYRQPYTEGPDSLSWLYGYDGRSLLVAHEGGISLVSNGGAPIGDVRLPMDTRCEPVRWWDADTFLAACYGQGPASAPLDEYGNPHTYYGRLWLLETGGAAGTALTAFPAEPPPVVDFGYHDAWPGREATFLQWTGDCGAARVATLGADGRGVFLPVAAPASLTIDGVEMVDLVDRQLTVYGREGCDGRGAVFAVDESGAYRHDLVPAVGTARGVIGVVGLATVYP